MTLLDTPPGAPAPCTVPSAPAPTFANPLYPGADPWVIRHEDAYFLCQARHNGQIVVSRSDSPLHPGHEVTAWTPPRTGWNRAQVWAPELHRIGSRWYIYYAASDGRNANHRMGVLESTSDDPQSPYVERSQLYTGDSVATGARNRWAIDGTILQLHGRLYFLWSGWESHEDIQHLYIARMSDPYTIASNRVRLCGNSCHAWEHVSDCRSQRGLNEAPQVLVRDGKACIVYSCSGSWEPTYKLGLLHMSASDDPMNPSSWTKHPLPVFESTADVFGVGHCSFTTSPDGSEDWILYHAKTSRRSGWCDRAVRAQPFTWTRDGLPHFGSPLPNGVPLPLPGGLRETSPDVALAS